MLFNSIEFLFFLPIVFLLYWFVFKGRRWQNLLIVVASYVFYGWWDWRFLFLIALTSFCSYESGVLLERYEGRRRQQKYVSAANIVLNLLILGLFKYFNFFVESLNPSGLGHAQHRPACRHQLLYVPGPQLYHRRLSGQVEGHPRPRGVLCLYQLLPPTGGRSY